MSRYAHLPQHAAEEEMEAAFNDPGDDEDDYDDEDDDHGRENSSRPLLPPQRNRQSNPSSPFSSHPLEGPSSYAEENASSSPVPSRRHAPTRTMSGTYDFEYDYASMAPPGSPPRPSAVALPNAYGNSNGQVPAFASTASGFRPPNVLRRALGAILPTHYSRDRRGGGTGNDGVFANVTAKPAAPMPARARHEGDEDPQMVPEYEQKDAPPSYQTAQRDTVPPYWETTILAPGGALDGEIMIEQLPVGSVFVFLWNLLVSVSFQFVGFLLTYLLHTTHASKYGSRAGLGITLIQYGFYMRAREDSDPNAANLDTGADNFWGGGWPPQPSADDGSLSAGVGETDSSQIGATVRRALPMIVNFVRDSLADGSSMSNSTTTMPDGTTVNQMAAFTISEWMSFMLMTLGWFLLITSCLGYWRIKRWERSIAQSQNSAPSGDLYNGASSGGGDGPFTLGAALFAPFGMPSSGPARSAVFPHGDPTPEDEARNAEILRSLEAAFGITVNPSNANSDRTIEAQRNARERPRPGAGTAEENAPLTSADRGDTNESSNDAGMTRGARRFFRF